MQIMKSIQIIRLVIKKHIEFILIHIKRNIVS